MDDIGGNADYDAATAIWGGSWRMPLKTEFNELYSSCTWTWTTLNDVSGYEITGTNGNSIFLPVTGAYSSASLKNSSTTAYYWSSTPTGTNYAYYLYFKSSSKSITTGYRYLGCPIRPVCD